MELSSDVAGDTEAEVTTGRPPQNPLSMVDGKDFILNLPLHIYTGGYSPVQLCDLAQPQQMWAVSYQILLVPRRCASRSC